MESKKLTPKQYLKLHPDKYVMVTYEFGKPLFIAPLKDLQVKVTPNRSEAEIWSEMDHTPTKLQYHITWTGYNGLKFEKVISHIKQYSISSTNDVKEFFKEVHKLFPMEWHPDDNFHEFLKEDERTRAFTDDEAIYLNAILTECFQFCDENELDIYDIAGEVQIDIWRSEGKWSTS